MTTNQKSITIRLNMIHKLLRATAKLKNFNSEANELLQDKTFLPMIKYAGTLMFLAVIIDLGTQLTEAIQILTQ